MHEHVLLVEDEHDVRYELKRALVRRKFVVFEAASYAEVVNVLRRPRRSIDVAVVDYTLPHLSGREVVDLIRVESPQLAVIMITGNADAPAGACVHDQRLEGFLEKPFSPEELALQIRKARKSTRDRAVAILRDPPRQENVVRPRAEFGSVRRLSQVDRGDPVALVAVVDGGAAPSVRSVCRLGVHAIVACDAVADVRQKARHAAEIVATRELIHAKPDKRRHLLDAKAPPWSDDLEKLMGFELLSTRMREYFRLRLRGESLEAISTRRGVSVSTVKEACALGRRRLGIDDLATFWESAANQVEQWWEAHGVADPRVLVVAPPSATRDALTWSVGITTAYRTADEPRDAVASIREFDPDVVILDPEYRRFEPRLQNGSHFVWRLPVPQSASQPVQPSAWLSEAMRQFALCGRRKRRWHEGGTTTWDLIPWSSGIELLDAVSTLDL